MRSSLHAEGWTQGSLVRATLAVSTMHVVAGKLESREHCFGLWALVTQDCDLDQTDGRDDARQVELRPLFDARGIHVDGIRSRALRVTDSTVLKADGPRLILSARALHTLAQYRENVLSDERRRELKTWLGLRYDRPAVPVPFDRLAREQLHPTIMRAMPTALQAKVRDVLVYYESPTEIRLFAVLRDAADRETCLDWLDRAGQLLSEKYKIGVLERQAEDSYGTPLAVVETYYGLDSAELSISASC
jgi:hypothetical protein